MKCHPDFFFFSLHKQIEQDEDKTETTNNGNDDMEVEDGEKEVAIETKA